MDLVYPPVQWPDALCLPQEKDQSLLEMDENSQSILELIRDTSSHSLLTSKATIPIDWLYAPRLLPAKYPDF